MSSSSAIGNAGFGLAGNLKYNEWLMDSNERSAGSLDHPEYVFPNDFHEVVGFKVLEAQIPFTYYTVDTTNNSFTLLENNLVPHTVTLNVGNYQTPSMITELSRALNAAGGAGSYAVSYNPTTLKFTVTNNGSGNPFILRFSDTSGATNPRLLLGFNGGDNLSTSGAGGFLVAPNVGNLAGPDYIFLCSNRLGILNNESLRRGDLNQSGPVIARIPVDVNAGGVIAYTDPDPHKYYEIDANVLAEADLYIAMNLASAQSLKPLSLNGLGFSVKIAFITVDTLGVKRSAGVQIGGRAKRVFIQE